MQQNGRGHHGGPGIGFGGGNQFLDEARVEFDVVIQDQDIPAAGEVHALLIAAAVTEIFGGPVAAQAGPMMRHDGAGGVAGGTVGMDEFEILARLGAQGVE